MKYLLWIVTYITKLLNPLAIPLIELMFSVVRALKLGYAFIEVFFRGFTYTLDPPVGPHPGVIRLTAPVKDAEDQDY